MTEVQGSKDCGNSPKNKFAQDVAIALETGESTLKDFHEDVIWERVAAEPIEGRSKLNQQLAVRAKPAIIIIEHAISHGKVGAVNGEVTLANGNKQRFCHVLEFTNARQTASP